MLLAQRIQLMLELGLCHGNFQIVKDLLGLRWQNLMHESIRAAKGIRVVYFVHMKV